MIGLNIKWLVASTARRQWPELDFCFGSFLSSSAAGTHMDLYARTVSNTLSVQLLEFVFESPFSFFKHYDINSNSW